MTRKEAIDLLDNLIGMVEDNHNSNYDEALKMGIKALEQEPCCNCIEFKRYAKEMGFEIEQEPILDKIRAEIKGMTPTYHSPDWSITDLVPISEVLNVIDKYKTESEE